MITSIRELLVSNQEALSEFDSRLLKAGYLDSHSENYTRQFSVAEIRNLFIDEHFPRMIPATVPAGIRAARYEIDLDQVACIDVPADEMYKRLGIV